MRERERERERERVGEGGGIDAVITSDKQEMCTYRTTNCALKCLLKLSSVCCRPSSSVEAVLAGSRVRSGPPEFVE